MKHLVLISNRPALAQADDDGGDGGDDDGGLDFLDGTLTGWTWIINMVYYIAEMTMLVKGGWL